MFMEVKKMVGQGEIWTNGLTGQAEKNIYFWTQIAIHNNKLQFLKLHALYSCPFK